jgi:hypothetical protein
MRIIEEGIFAGVESPEYEDRRRVGCKNLLFAQLIAFKFGGRIAIVAQLQLEPPVGRYLERSGAMLPSLNSIIKTGSSSPHTTKRAASKIAAKLHKPPTSVPPFNRRPFFQFPRR